MTGFTYWVKGLRLANVGLAMVMTLGLAVVSARAQTSVVTVAGSAGVPGSSNTSGPATAARFNYPEGIALNAAATYLYVADQSNDLVRRIDLTSGAVTSSPAVFSRPAAVAVAADGTVFVADTLHHQIKKVSADLQSVLSTYGSGTPAFDNGTSATTASFSSPQGVAVSPDGKFIYVSDTNNHVIRRISVDTNSIVTVGGVAGSSGFAVGAPGDSKFFFPSGLAYDATGSNLFVADMGNNAVRRIALSTSVLANNVTSTVAGTGSAGNADAGAQSTFRGPRGLTVDAAGALLVTDLGNNTVRKITSTAWASAAPVVSTVAGSGSAAVLDGVATAASFYGPWGIASDAAGSFYVADYNGHVIRRGAPSTAPTITVQPTPTSATWTVGTTTSVTFTVTAAGSPTPTVKWQRQTAAGTDWTDLTEGGSYAGVATRVLTLSAITATSNGDKFRAVVANPSGQVISDLSTLVVNQAPTITSGNTATFTVNSPGTTFQVTATGSPTPTYSATGLPGWASIDATTGVISGTPTDDTGTPFTVTLRAINSVATATQTFTLSVLRGPTIATAPASQSISVGLPVNFTVVATGTPLPSSYQWQRQAYGTVGFVNISDGGLYSGANTPTLSIASTSTSMSGDQIRVLVGNGIATTTSAIATLTVAQAPQITSLNNATFVVGVPGTFTVTASGSPAVTAFTITSGSLPAGVTLDAATGVLSGTAVATTGSPFALTLQAANGVNPAATQSFTLTVAPTPTTPVFTTQPVAVASTISQNASFTAVATGDPVPTYQWQRQAAGTSGFVNLVESATYVGTQTGTLVVNNLSTGMSGDIFAVVATNNTGSTTSSYAALTVTPGLVITTIAGTAGTSGVTDATGAAARFYNPSSIALDSDGSLYVADSSNHVIRRISSTGVVTTLAGKAGISGSADGTGADARFNNPSGLAIDASGVIYVADSFNHTIRAVNRLGVVTTLAGSAGLLGSANGTGTSARFAFPTGIAADPYGVIYVSDNGNHTIRRIAANGAVTTLAGSAGLRGSADGTGTDARFAYPGGLAVDSLGNVYVADSFNHAVRKVTSAGVVTTLAGSNAGLSGSADGTGSAARFYQPYGVAVDALGTVVYVADTYNNTIRKIATGGVVTTYAGLAGSVGSTDGLPAAARFNQPQAIVLDLAGNLYVADTRNNTVRKTGVPTAPVIGTQPSALTAGPGSTATFTVVASGAPTPSFQWQRQAAGTSDFVNLTNTSPYSGVTTGTLTITGVTTAMQGDQFRAVVTNQVSPDAISSAVALNTVSQAPAITSPASATFSAGVAGSFTVVATGSPAPTFTATGLPPWANLTPAGVLTGTPPDATGSPFSVVVTASNGIPVTQNLTLTVLTAPVITAQPVAAEVAQGASTTLSVTAIGGTPLSYQWSRNGITIPGATATSLSLVNVQSAAAGDYRVTITNPSGSVTSAAVPVTVIATPSFVSQPRSQTVVAGSAVNLGVSAQGGASFSYQWRKNGVNIAGATGATFTIATATAADAGNYDVIVTNSAGASLSAMALVTVSAAPAAPVVTAAPASRTALAGSSVTLSVAASGAPAPTFQWRKNGQAIAGATNATFTLASVAAGDAANYDVVVTNSQGSVNSAAGSLRVIAKSYAGSYFGTLSGGQGSFALYVRDDNTGVFLAYLPGSQAPIASFSVLVADNGVFSFSQTAIAGANDDSDRPRAAALAATSVSGTIAADGSITGTVSGGATGTLSATRASAVGATQAVAGLYRSAAAANGSVAYTIVGGSGQAFALTQVGTAVDGGSGTATAAGVVTVVGSRSTLTQTIASTGTIAGTSTGSLAATLSGANEETLASQRIANISARARITSGAGLAIAGFVINGNESKPVLIRAVGPTLASFGLTSALAAPVLELYNAAGTKIAANTGVSSASNAAAIAAAGTAAGAFALGNAGTDSAILTTLAPGAYTAQVSGANNTQGVALIEVYDLSPASTAQKLFNISTRATAGTGDATLTAGIVVTGNASKRVLIRAVGPGLAQFGLTGTLPAPVLVLTAQGQTVATGSNWSASADAAAITAASAQAGAFPMAAGDAAMIVNLAPGAYTAQVTNAAGASGVALVEVYELP